MLFAHHSHHVSLLWHKPMNRFFLFQFMYFFAKGVIYVFFPIYLYKMGLSLIVIVFYFLVLNVFYSIFVPLFANIIQRIGIILSYFLAILFAILFLISIHWISYDVFIIPLLITNIFQCISALFFYPTHHLETVLITHEKKEGKEIGMLSILNTMALSIAPVIGGILLSMFGYTATFIVSSGIMICSIIPLLGIQEPSKTHIPILYGDIWKTIRSDTYKKELIAHYSNGNNVISDALSWPILLSMIFIGYDKIGFLFGFSTLICVISMWIVGNKTDKNNKHDILKQGVWYFFWSGILRIVMILVQQIIIIPWGVFLGDTAVRVSSHYARIPFMAIFYTNAKHKQFMYIVLREVVENSAKILHLSFLCILLYYWGDSALLISILLGAIASLGLLSLQETHE